MTSPILHAAAGASGRYWSLLHRGTKHSLDWDDGERLLALSSAIRAGRLEPQAFSFVARGSIHSAAAEVVFVTADDPLELLTEYDNTTAPGASHWFG